MTCSLEACLLTKRNFVISVKIFQVKFSVNYPGYPSPAPFVYEDLDCLIKQSKSHFTRAIGHYARTDKGETAEAAAGNFRVGDMNYRCKHFAQFSSICAWVGDEGVHVRAFTHVCICLRSQVLPHSQESQSYIRVQRRQITNSKQKRIGNRTMVSELEECPGERVAASTAHTCAAQTRPGARDVTTRKRHFAACPFPSSLANNGDSGQ